MFFGVAMYRYLKSIGLAFVIGSLAGLVEAQDRRGAMPAGFTPKKISLVEAFPAVSFTRPLDFQVPKGAFSDSVFIVEQGGRIRRIVNNSSSTQATVFLDVSDKISTEGAERGLLGLAFHPNFASNGFIFVNYTRLLDGATVISRFTLQSGASSIDSASEKVFLVIGQPFPNHNAGSLAFGRDGFLYIPLGDGGSAGDPLGNGQNKASYLGKILRIDIDRSEGDTAYAIPSSNPFKGNSKGFKQEIFAYGLRNPFKITFDKQTGLLWTGDVGQDRKEEIDIIRNGRNYGWNKVEGDLCYPSGKRCAPRGFEPPIKTYGHSLGASITGGYVYRGTAIASLKGAYVYADFISGNLWALKKVGDRYVNRLLSATGLNISSFGQDQSNELYIVGYNGKIYRLTT